MAINLNIVPKVLFMAMRMDFKKEFYLAIGDYCEVYNGTDNASKAWRKPCLALYLCNNTTGSWAFLNLVTMQSIRQTQWTKVFMTEELVAKVSTSGGVEEAISIGICAAPTTTNEDVVNKQVQPMDLVVVQPEPGPLQGNTLGVRDSGIMEEECLPLEDQGEDDSASRGGVDRPKKFAMATIQNR
jgi:hypothetical protein